jgi:hypothetical protein
VGGGLQHLSNSQIQDRGDWFQGAPTVWGAPAGSVLVLTVLCVAQPAPPPRGAAALFSLCALARLECVCVFWDVCVVVCVCVCVLSSPVIQRRQPPSGRRALGAKGHPSGARWTCMQHPALVADALHGGAGPRRWRASRQAGRQAGRQGDGLAVAVAGSSARAAVPPRQRVALVQGTRPPRPPACDAAGAAPFAAPPGSQEHRRNDFAGWAPAPVRLHAALLCRQSPAGCPPAAGSVRRPQPRVGRGSAVASSFFLSCFARRPCRPCPLSPL